MAGRGAGKLGDMSSGDDNADASVVPHASSVPRKSRAVLAERLPHHVLACIFEFLPLNDLVNVMCVCRHWFAYLDYEDCEVWQRLCRVHVPDTALADPYLLAEVPTHKSKLRSFMHGWNPLDCSRNAYIKTNGFTLHRNPIAQSTDGVRSKIGLNKGRHSWEIWWEGPLGTVAVVGAATKHSALQCPGYVALLGSDDQGWAWNLVDNTLMHNGKIVSRYPLMPDPPRYQVGDKIRVILDCDAHMMYFERKYEFLGVAFRDLPPVRLYPCVCAVYGNTEVSMVYLGPPTDG